jgi:hypothetical protein
VSGAAVWKDYEAAGRTLGIEIRFVDVKGPEEFEITLNDLLKDREKATAIGERGRGVFNAQAGATARTVQTLMALLQERSAAAR